MEVTETEEKYAIVGIVCALLLGLVVGFVSNPVITQATAPADHKTVIDNITIIDTKTNKQLTPRFWGSRTSKMLSLVPLQFSPNKTYTQSDWGFYSMEGNYADLNAVVSVWGPSDDGKTYNVEVARLMGNPATITVGQRTFTWSEGTNIGYFYTTIIIE